MNAKKENLKKDIQEILKDEGVQKSLSYYTKGLAQARSEALEGFDWAKHQGRVCHAKRRTIEKLTELVNGFTDEAGRAGARIYFAETGDKAVDYIIGLAQDRHVQNIAKSCSYTLKEIGLTGQLRSEGFEVSETDLGNWVLPYAGVGASHSMFPSLHLTVERMAEAMAKVCREDIKPEPSRLVRKAREILLRKALSAQMGITSANVAVAENGSLMISENEGNCRMLATLPSIHVAVVGIDKLVERTEDAITILRVLNKAASGDKISSYVSWIRGPVPYTEEGNDPRELHIILLDNGRLRARKDIWYQEIFQCIRCGACQNVCPVFKAVGGEVFGDFLPGPMGVIFAQVTRGSIGNDKKLDLCLQCGECKRVCSGRIDIPELFLQLRQDRVRQNGFGFSKNILHRKVLRNRKTLRTVARLGSVLQRPFVDKNKMIRSIPFLAGQTRARSFSPLARRTFRDVWSNLTSGPIPKPIATVALFTGCGVNYFYPDIGEAVVRLLRAIGVQVEYPAQQGCCGAASHHDGDMDTMIQLARENVDLLASQQVDFIITLCPSCGLALKETYPGLDPENEQWRKKTAQISGKIKSFSQFLVDMLSYVPESKRFVDFGEEDAVTYHSPCGTCRGLGLKTQTRQLIHQLDGTEFVEMEDAGSCCGFGKTFSFTFPEISGEILRKKMENIEATGAQAVITDCPGCIFQIRGGLDRRGSRIETFHIADYLAWKMGLVE